MVTLRTISWPFLEEDRPSSAARAPALLRLAADREVPRESAVANVDSAAVVEDRTAEAGAASSAAGRRVACEEPTVAGIAVGDEPIRAHTAAATKATVAAVFPEIAGVARRTAASAEPTPAAVAAALELAAAAATAVIAFTSVVPTTTRKTDSRDRRRAAAAAAAPTRRVLTTAMRAIRAALVPPERARSIPQRPAPAATVGRMKSVDVPVATRSSSPAREATTRLESETAIAAKPAAATAPACATGSTDRPISFERAVLDDESSVQDVDGAAGAQPTAAAVTTVSALGIKPADVGPFDCQVSGGPDENRRNFCDAVRCNVRCTPTA